MEAQPGLIKSLFERTPGTPANRIARFLQDPVASQRGLLHSLLKRARLTEFGQTHDFDELIRETDLVKAFQHRLGLNEYDDLHPYIQLARNGESDILWRGITRNFAVSSGTSAAGKLIPASDDMLRVIRRSGIDAIVNYTIESGRFDILGGKLLAVSGKAERDAALTDTFVGEMTGLVNANAPWLITNLWQAVSDEVLQIDNWDKKLRAIAATTVDSDVRIVAMVPSWAPVLFEHLLAKTGSQSIKEIWPRFSTFFSSGVPLSSYRQLLEKYIGGDVNFIELYTASEGFFAFQDRLNADDMLLHLNSGVFYEFVHMSELGTPHAKRLTIADVEVGERYAMYVSTCAGLWAYEMRDVVIFTSTFPHRIVVAGRTSDMLDAYGEAVFGDEVRDALITACGIHNAHLANYHISPAVPEDVGSLPRHQWLVEFVKEPEDLESLANSIDERLCQLNRHYRIRREGRAFRSPSIVHLPRGTFEKWLRGARKQVSAQTKVPRIRQDNTIASQLLALAEDGRRKNPVSSRGADF